MAEHNEPWKWEPNLRTTYGLGGFVDANGEQICWFGDEEMYYQTCGDPPSEEDARRIVACVNFCRQFDTEWLEKHEMLKLTPEAQFSSLKQPGYVAVKLVPVDVTCNPVASAE